MVASASRIIRSAAAVCLLLAVSACGSGNEGEASVEDLGASLTVTWDAVPDPSILGYRLYYGSASRFYQGFIQIGATTGTVYHLLHGNTYYFSVTAFNGAGESPYSEEVAGTTPAAAGDQAGPGELDFRR